ncbi:MAG: hypothetical protein ABJF11_03580 [Reichenbachiella sp.]|uniref:hypothetical protein n=1 Tax=Reichenbachiella sp. TaxID=2184521 RepID=UPI0032657091
MKTLKKNFLWVFYFGFVVLAVVYRGDEHLFISNGAYPLGKPFTWLMYFAFLGYSLYCSSKESFFKSLKRIYPYLWARQIGTDLYIGLVFSSFLIYLNEGSVLVLLLWLVPILVYANLAILLYIAMNYDSIVAHFVG